MSTFSETQIYMYSCQPYSKKQKQLRMEGVKALKMESLDHLNSTINDNLTDLVEMIRAQNNKPFNPRILIKKTLINVMLSMVCKREQL